MSSRRMSLWMWMLVLVLVVSATAPAFPQEAEGDEATPEEVTIPSGTPQSETVDQILEQQERLLTGARFSYDPEGRRDPFRNPNSTAANGETQGCTEGISCMVVAEIDLSGIVKDGSDGNVAMFLGSDNNGYFLRVGDSVFDGTIIGIDPRLGTVTFRQEVDDPTRIKPYRDVVKRLVALDNEESS